ncbi:hypothetical protein BGX23_003009, partial [Mortierella sp. AD031]
MAIGAALSVVSAAPVAAPNKGVLTNQDVCTTPECYNTATAFLNYMNPEVDPCEDFSQFTCGGFYAKAEELIRAISDPAFGQSPTPAADDTAAQSNLKKLHDLFSSCMDVKEMEKRGREPLVNEIHEVLSSLPSNATTVDRSSLARTLAKLIKLEIKPFINLEVEEHLYNPYVNIIKLNAGGFSLDLSKYNKTLPDSANLAKDIASEFQAILGTKSTHNTTRPVTVEQKWIDAAIGVVAFETAWAEALLVSPEPQTTGYAATFNQWAFADIVAATPSIDWNLLVSELLPAGETYTRSLYTNMPDPLHALETVLNVTSTETLRNYFTWRIISAHNANLGTPYNTVTSLERWKFCVGVVNENLGDIAGHYFVDMTMPDTSKIYFKKMIDGILASYGQAFQTLGWLDPDTRANALKKLHAIVELIAESSDAPNTASLTSLEEYYRNYAVDATDYFGNLARRSVWTTANNFAEVNKPVNRKELPKGPPQTVNAFYGPQTNQIYFPAGLLQNPVYHVDNPDYMNYGGIGTVAGHEIGHGFDNSGKEFDFSGNYTNWWTSATETAFNEKSKCIVDQYSDLTISGVNNKTVHVNGQFTLGENIADNGGIKYSYRAWETAYKSDPTGTTHKNYKLPGFEKYTPEQMFFISFGRIWCEKRTPFSAENQITSDNHSPSRLRIIGSVQNSHEFARAFNCKPNTPMNPVKKCEL